MSSFVIDTNVLVLATAAMKGWARPRVPTNDQQAIQAVFEWVKAFRNDPSLALVMDFPEKTILIEYKNNLNGFQLYGREVVQHKFDTGCFDTVDLTYWKNGDELIADLPDPKANQYFHDLGDRKMVSAAFAAGSPIVNAADGDWTEEDVVTGLTFLGVCVEQLLTDEQRLTCKERP